ncbi:MAG: four helix bundle protein [Candidatus Margulisiibacteriota bacterium]|nr:four helix bundle protein [Candidatus Margulisiibacteriota bacterium]
MFDFEKFDVYKKAKQLTKELSELISSLKYAHPRLIDQLQRATLSIPLNIAEGAGRYSKADKRHFYIIARGSVFECVAILDVLLDMDLIRKKQKAAYYERLEELSKMISGLINSQK